MASILGMRERLWRNNIPYETGFWEQYLDTCGGPLWSTGYNRRIDPNSTFDADVGRFLKDENATVLDVGAGPITMLGYVWNGHRVRVTAVDPLAKEYDAMLAKRGIVPAVRTQEGRAEELDSILAPDSFDVTHARNCLDHSIDARRAIERMYAVTKPGGVVYLRHVENEALHQNFRGLHRWNFTIDTRGDMLLSTPGKPTVNLSTLFERVETERKKDNGFVEAVIRKPLKPA
jgi:SAM-dependent methyltransferase